MHARSQTTRDRTDACDGASVRVAFRISYCVGAPGNITFAAQWLAYTLPGRRFTVALAGAEVGLGGSVWGNDSQEAARLATRLECGTAWVNQHGALNLMALFGGVKCSGIGVEFNVDGLKEYTTIQVLNVAL